MKARKYRQKKEEEHKKEFGMFHKNLFTSYIVFLICPDFIEK